MVEMAIQRDLFGGFQARIPPFLLRRDRISTRCLRGDDQMFQHAEGKAQVLLLGHW